jgi:hypothetical protein
MLGISFEPEKAVEVKTVQSAAPYRSKTVQPVSPFEAETVKPNAPFLAKRCNSTAETVQPVSPPLLYSSSNNKTGEAANKAHHAGALPRLPRTQKSRLAGFEVVIAKYRAEMRKHHGPGNAADRADTLPEVKAQRLWAKLESEDRIAAEEAIPAYGRRQNSYMQNPDKYLENRPWRAMAAAAPQKQEAQHSVELRILTGYARTGDWPEEAREHWGAPPERMGSRVPTELWREAQNVVRGLNEAGGLH